MTRKLQAAVLAEGPGQKYLIQHSAGSGKTNSIAWTAHFLADLHNAGNEKIFDSVLVISDRNVIDGQLQDAVRDFERTSGVVAIIKGDGGSKSGDLAEALSGDKKIIVCTIQTFPALQKKMLELTTQGKQQLKLPGSEFPTLDPITAAGSGSIQEKQKAYLNEIIEKVNDLFKVELTDNDKLVYVNNVILGKLLESKILIQQALNNSKEQFANSPDLDDSLMNAIMEALDAHNLMSSQALSSEAIRKGLKAILLGPAKLYETLRDQKSI